MGRQRDGQCEVGTGQSPNPWKEDDGDSVSPVHVTMALCVSKETDPLRLKIGA